MPTPIPVPMPTLQDPNYPHQYERLARSRSTSRPRPDTIPRDDFGNPLAALSTSPPDAPGMPGQFSPPAAGFATYRTPSPPPPLPASRSSQYFEDVDGRVAEPEAAPLPLPMALRPAPGQPPYPVSDFGG